MQGDQERRDIAFYTEDLAKKTRLLQAQKDRLRVLQGERQPTRNYWNPFASPPKPIIANKETREELDHLPKNRDEAETHFRGIQDEIRDLTRQISESEADVAKAKTTLELESLAILEDDETDVESYDEDLSGTSSEGYGPSDDSVSMPDSDTQDSTVVPSYEGSKERLSDTSSEATTDSRHRSQVEERNEAVLHKIELIKRDRENFKACVLRLKRVNRDLEGIEDQLKQAKNAIQDVETAFKSLQPDFAFGSVEGVPSVEDMEKQDDLMAKPIQIFGHYPTPTVTPIDHLEALDSSDLIEVYHLLKEDADRRKQYLDIVRSQYGSLEPKSSISKFFYAINLFFTHLFGGKTKFEKATQAKEKCEEDVKDVITSLRRVVATSRVYRRLVEADTEHYEIKKSELTENQTNDSTQLRSLIGQYSGIDTPMDDLSDIEDRLLPKFDALIQKETRFLDEKKITDDFIRRTRVIVGMGSSARVKKALGRFLENPIEDNRRLLQESMKANANYLRDKDLVTLMIEVHAFYPKLLPRIPFCKMSDEKINAHFEELIIPIEEEIALRRQQQVEINQTLASISLENLETRRKIEDNFKALIQCKNLKLSAELASREKEDEVEARALVEYLDQRLLEILKEIPEQDKDRAEEIMGSKAWVSSLDYERSREEIRAIFDKVGIHPPEGVLTYQTIVAWCDSQRVEKTEKEAMLTEILALPGIESQYKIGDKALSSEDIYVGQGIQAFKTFMENLGLEMEAISITEDDNADTIESIFTTFVDQSRRDPIQALQTMKTALMKYTTEYPGVYDELLAYIDSFDKIYEDNIEAFMIPVDRIEDHEREGLRSESKARSDLEAVTQDLGDLSLKKEEMRRLAGYCIELELPPPGLPTEIKVMIAECESKGTVIKGSIWNAFSSTKPVYLALKDFLSLPTDTHLIALDKLIKAPSSKTGSDKALMQLLEKAKAFYPALVIPVTPEAAIAATNSAKSQIQQIVVHEPPSSTETPDDPSSGKGLSN